MQGGSERPRVLIVEDDRILAKMYSEKFSMEGFEVQTAADGEEGLKIAQQEIPDAILLDIMLPKYDGHEFLKKLVKDEATGKIPVIALTNLTERKEAGKALQFGAKEYLAKAMHTPDEIVKKVKKYLR